ncbi:MAG: hypothetical protein PSX80_05175 [bacterium]|nr:hypothetical protein [bacterium]
MIVDPAAESHLRLVVNIRNDPKDTELARFIPVIRGAELIGSGRVRVNFYTSVGVFRTRIICDG